MCAPRSTPASTSRSRDRVVIAGRDPARRHLRREPRPDRAVAALLFGRRRIGARLRLPAARPARPGVRRSDRRPQPRRIRARGARSAQGVRGQFRHRPVHRRRQYLHLDHAKARRSALRRRHRGSLPHQFRADPGRCRHAAQPAQRRSARSPSTSRSARHSDGRDEPDRPRSRWRRSAAAAAGTAGSPRASSACCSA